MAREELAAWLRLLLTPGVGNETARKLLAAFGLPQTVFAQSLTALQIVVGARIAYRLDAMALDPRAEHVHACAARDLGVTPSAISQQLRTLEDSIGIALVSQEGRRVVMTPTARIRPSSSTAMEKPLALEAAPSSLVCIRLPAESYFIRATSRAPLIG